MQSGHETRALTAREAEALVSLRGLLDEAVHRVADRTIVGRRVAAVLLDGAAEAALGVGLAAFDVVPSTNANFEKLEQQLVEEVRPLIGSRRFAGRAEVHRLHRVRNDAQHLQIPPDHETLVRWSASVEAFVADIVTSVYRVDLRTVTASAAVGDKEIREAIADAESCLDSDPRAAVDHLRAAFGTAVHRWHSHHERIFRRPTIWPGGAFDGGLSIGREIEALTADLDELVRITPFALDLGEFYWWKALIEDARDEQVVITAGDARRALVFVFTWVLRWEAFTQSLTNRERVFDEEEPVPLTTRPDGRPERDPSREPEIVVREQRIHGTKLSRTYWLNVPYRESPWRHRSDPSFSNILGQRDADWPWLEGHAHRGTITLRDDPNDFRPDLLFAGIERAFDLEVERQSAAVQAAEAAREARLAEVARVEATQAGVLAILDEAGRPAFTEVVYDTTSGTQQLGIAKFRADIAERVRRLLLTRRDRPDVSPGQLRSDGIGVPVAVLDDIQEIAAAGVRAVEDFERALAAEETSDREAEVGLRERLREHLVNVAFSEKGGSQPASGA